MDTRGRIVYFGGGWTVSAHVRVTALIGAASAAAVLMTGCSSSSAKPSAAAGSSTTAAAASATPGSGTSTSSGTPGALGTPAASADPGCQEALSAIGTLGANISNIADPSSAIDGYNQLAAAMVAGAAKAKAPGAKDAITKLAGDFQSFAVQLKNGTTPDQSAFSKDATAMATACS
jgi:hypothetical protein